MNAKCWATTSNWLLKQSSEIIVYQGRSGIWGSTAPGESCGKFTLRKVFVHLNYLLAKYLQYLVSDQIGMRWLAFFQNGHVKEFVLNFSSIPSESPNLVRVKFKWLLSPHDGKLFYLAFSATSFPPSRSLLTDPVDVCHSQGVYVHQ